VPVEVVKRPSSGEGRTPGGMGGFVIEVGGSRSEGVEGVFGDVGDAGPGPPERPMLRLRNDIVVGNWRVFGVVLHCRASRRR